MSSPSGNNNKVPKLEPLCSPIKQATDVFDFSQENVISNTKNAIDLVLETINMIDKNISSSRYSSSQNVISTSGVRGKLYTVLDVLRKMTPNHGNRMHVNQLSDDCLVTIFTKNFSLQKIMRSFRPVCHRWKAVVEDSICAPKRSLKLFGGLTDPWEYGKKLLDSNMFADKQLQLRKIGHQDHDLVLSRWTLDHNRQFFRTLGVIFPNVQHLVIGVQNVSSSNHSLLCRFISIFPGLIRLTVFFKWNAQATEPTMLCESFFSIIGSMKLLKHLDFLGDSMLGCDKIAHHLSHVFPQLEHLSIENAQYGVARSILSKLGSNLRSLRIYQFDNFQEIIQNSLRLELTTNITELRVSKVTDLQTVEFVCQTFSHLNKLELSFEISDNDDNLPTFPLDSHLLTTLNHHPQIDSLSLENLQIDLNSFTPSTFAPSTVKSLHLSNLSSNQTYSDGAQLIRTLASIFPHIQQLDYQFGVPMSLRAFDYSNCKIDNEFVRKHFPRLRDCRVYYRHCGTEYLGRLGSHCFCSGAIELDYYEACENETENSDSDEGEWDD